MLTFVFSPQLEGTLVDYRNEQSWDTKTLVFQLQLCYDLCSWDQVDEPRPQLTPLLNINPCLLFRGVARTGLYKQACWMWTVKPHLYILRRALRSCVWGYWFFCNLGQNPYSVSLKVELSLWYWLLTGYAKLGTGWVLSSWVGWWGCSRTLLRQC